MPNNRTHSQHHPAKTTSNKRLMKAIRGGLILTNPKLGCVPASDLAKAVIETFPKAFLDACSAQMKLTPMMNRIASEGKWLFQVPTDGLLGDRSITDCFRDLAVRIRAMQGGTVAEVRARVAPHAAISRSERPCSSTQTGQDRALFILQLDRVEDLHALERSLPNGWKKDEVIKCIRLRNDAQLFEKEMAAFRRDIQTRSRSELKMLDSIAQPVWKRKAIKHRLKQIADDHNRQLCNFRRWLNDQNLEQLRSLPTSFDMNWKNEEVRKRLEIMERQEQERLRLEAHQKHQREVRSFTELLTRKTVEELEQMRDSPLQAWMQYETTKRLNEIRVLQRARETEELMATLKGKVVSTLCEMAESHPQGWQSDLICDRIIHLLPALGIDFIERMAKESGKGIQRVVEWATAEVHSRQRAKELAELVVQLNDKKIDELASMASLSIAAWKNVEIARQVEKLIPDADFDVLMRLRTSDIPRIAEVANAELIHRRQKHESVRPKTVRKWV